MKKVTQKGHLSLRQSWMRFVFRAMFVPPFLKLRPVYRGRGEKASRAQKLDIPFALGYDKKDF